MKNRQKIKAILENYLHPSKGSARFAAKHLVTKISHADEVDGTVKVKAHPRFKHRHGYDTDATSKMGIKDYQVYEGVIDPFEQNEDINLDEKLKHVKTYEHGNNKATILADSKSGHHRVKFTINGRHYKPFDIHTKNAGEAHEVAQHVIGEATQLVELSKATLKSYLSKANDHKWHAKNRLDADTTSRRTKRAKRIDAAIVRNRAKGIDSATKKLGN